jgi:hypothetical protein
MWQIKKYYIKRNEERNILPTIKGRKANWMSHILHRKCLPKHITEGKEGRCQG